MLDLRKTDAFTDFFVICTGANPRQVHAIADAVEQALKAQKVRPAHLEGYERAEWMLVDYFDFVVHVFSPAARISTASSACGETPRASICRRRTAGGTSSSRG